MVEPEPYMFDAWRRSVPSVTDDEVRALMPLVRERPGLLNMVIRAYRLGRREATSLPPPLSGHNPCPTCLSVYVTAYVWSGAEDAPLIMWARCRDCATLYRPSTGEVREESTDADRAVPDAASPDRAAMGGTPDGPRPL